MSSIRSTQNRHTFLRRKYCFLVASALSPPVGLIDPLMGRPPRCPAMLVSYSFSAAGAPAGALTGAPGMGAPGRGPDGSAAPAITCSRGTLGAAGGAGLRAARVSG